MGSEMCIRDRRGIRLQLATVAPLAFLALGLGVVALTGDLPAAGEFIRYSGTAASAGAFALAIVVGVLGEEAGWREYALRRLQLATVAPPPRHWL